MQSLERPGVAGVSVYVQASRPGFVPTHPLAPDFPAGGIGFHKPRVSEGYPGPDEYLSLASLLLIVFITMDVITVSVCFNGDICLLAIRVR